MEVSLPVRVGCLPFAVGSSRPHPEENGRQADEDGEM